MKEAQEALLVMKSGRVAAAPDSEPLPQIPHFLIDLSSDGVQVFDNSEQSECIPIMVSVHGISTSPSDEPFILKKRYPIVIGIAHGSTKPTAQSLMRNLFQELHQLDPNNHNNEETAEREFTVSLRCVIADWPFRSYLKRVKGHGGYWSCERCIQRGESCLLPKSRGSKKETSSTIQMKNTDAPLRTDEDFLSYTSDKREEDQHLLDPINDISPFVSIDFPMVSGFSRDTMHTYYVGAFRRRLKGLVSLTTEGKLSSAKLAEVDARLRLFESCKPMEFDRKLRSLSNCVERYKIHELRDFLIYYLFPSFSGILSDDQLENLLLLQYAMLLMGGFDPKPVHADDIAEASRVLKLYVEQLIVFGYPIRPTSHAIIHSPEDCAYFKCGVECISAFFYENFYNFFRKSLRSGLKPLEQWRNRLVERSKYLLPTASDGSILETDQMFKLEVKKFELEQSETKIVLDFSSKNRKEDLPLKSLTFSNFGLTNKFPENVFMLKNGVIAVCTDIIELPNSVFTKSLASSLLVAQMHLLTLIFPPDFKVIRSLN